MHINKEIELAWQCIENTGSHLFLTGKAGTGKTTFLRKLKEHTPKRMVVVAPTGIAAINAGGVTIHSFFQLSFAPYIPETKLTSKQSHYKFGKEKISIIRSMDLLVIDEVSMVRSDLLDAIDDVLRRYRNRHKPFGGVQLLMIGDLQQLAPVVKDDEWSMLSNYYDTPYFFGSHALKNTDYITIQLEHVYRQSDTTFLALLNRIRTNDIDNSVLAELNKRYIPNFSPRVEEGYIRLTTHNYQAQRINEQQLSLIPKQSYRFKAVITGSFPEASYPADVELTVKEGAQIMFIKNDTQGDKRYYNGKIGIVTRVTREGIFVKGNDDAKEFLLETDEWTNSKYTLNPDSKEIVEEVEGTFRQYPIRLAWAITIHKSQGLTFEHAIIDANASFAHGQVYVALSRCKTLEGMVLSSPLTMQSVISDESIDQYTNEIQKRVPDSDKLNDLQKNYFYEMLSEQFGFDNISRPFFQITRILDEHFYRLYPKLFERYKENSDQFQKEIVAVSERFKVEYSALIMNSENYMQNETLQQRLKSGARYFKEKTETILLELLRNTKVETDNKEVKKRFTEVYALLLEAVQVKLGTLQLTEKEGFKTSSYLRCKSHIIVSLSTNSQQASGRKSRQSSTPKIEVPTDILHPALYRQLVAWRNKEAAKAGQPVYTIIQQKAMLGIVNLLPTTADELEYIPYLGKRGIEKHGAELLDMVTSYVLKNKIEHKQLSLNLPTTSPRKKEKAPKEPKPDTKEVTYQLYKQGMSLKEIADTRGMSTTTIETHLEHYVRKGDIDIFKFVTQDKMHVISRYLRQNKDKKLSEIKQDLGDDYSYSEIKFVIAYFDFSK